MTLLVPLLLYFPVVDSRRPSRASCAGFGLSSLFSLPCKLSGCKFTALDWFGTGRKTKESETETQTSGSVSSNSRGISTQLKKNRKIGVEATVNCNLSFLVAEIFVFLNYSKIVLLRQENIRIMLAVLLLEKGQKLCSIPQIMPKIMLAQSARAYFTLPSSTQLNARNKLVILRHFRLS